MKDIRIKTRRLANQTRQVFALACVALCAFLTWPVSAFTADDARLQMLPDDVDAMEEGEALSAESARGLHPVRPLDAVFLPRENGAVSACTWYGPYAFKYAISGLYVSTEIGYSGADNGMLRARSSSIGAWERYYLCYDGSGYGIYSLANSRYVSNELGYTGGDYCMLRSRATSIGSWERFYLYGNSNGTYSWRSVANMNYVSTEIGYTGGDFGMLRARSTANYDWEKFYLVYAP